MIDEHSATWKDVKAWAEDRIQTQRERNDDPALAGLETAVLRGNIEILKELLELPHEDSLPEVDTPNYID